MKKRKGRCVHCRRLFGPDPRLKSRQRYCSSQECQTKRQRMNESQWLCKNPEVLAYKRSQTREWLRARPDYSRRRRQANPKLLESNRTWSRVRMREIRGQRWFDKTKSIFKPQSLVGKCRRFEDKTQSAPAGKSLGSVQ